MTPATSADRIRQSLHNVDFPAEKNVLVDVALSNGCDDDTARALRAIPPESYANIRQVLASVTLADDGDLTAAQKAQAHQLHTKSGVAQTAKDLPPVNPIVEELGENRGS